jgi:hypothetical protein
MDLAVVMVRPTPTPAAARKSFGMIASLVRLQGQISRILAHWIVISQRRGILLPNLLGGFVIGSGRSAPGQTEKSTALPERPVFSA